MLFQLFKFKQVQNLEQIVLYPMPEVPKLWCIHPQACVRWSLRVCKKKNVMAICLMKISKTSSTDVILRLIYTVCFSTVDCSLSLKVTQALSTPRLKFTFLFNFDSVQSLILCIHKFQNKWTKFRGIDRTFALLESWWGCLDSVIAWKVVSGMKSLETANLCIV